MNILFVEHGDIKLLDDTGPTVGPALLAPGRGGGVLVEGRGHWRHGALLLAPPAP